MSAKRVTPDINTIWQRKKGKQYRVVRIIKAEPHGTVSVLYEPVDGGEGWTIPLHNFYNKFTLATIPPETLFNAVTEDTPDAVAA